MIKEISIISGEHTEEKSALYLAPLVVEGLKNIGYNVMLFENPDKKTLLDFVLEAYREKNKMSHEFVNSKVLDYWRTEVLKQNKERLLFSLHNYNLNPTIFELPEEHEAFHDRMKSLFPFFSDLGGLEYASYSDQIFFIEEPEITTIEIPSIQEEVIPINHIKIAKEVIINFDSFKTHLLNTDMPRTRQKGLLEEDVVKTLVVGIDSLAKLEKRPFRFYI